MMIRASIILVLWLIAGQLEGQTPDELFNKYKADYPNESGVILTYEREITIKKIGDSIDISVDELQEILVLNNPAQWSKDKFYSSSFSRILAYEAYTKIPNKRKFKKAEVTDFKKTYNKDSYFFYDDTELLTFNYPHIALGSIIGSRHTYKITNPRIIGSFYLNSYTPTANAKLIINIADGIEILEGKYNPSDVLIERESKQSMDGFTTITYTAENIAKIDYKRDNPNFKTLSTSIFFTIKNFTDDTGQKIKVQGSLEDLYHWYRSLLPQTDETTQLDNILSEIITDDFTEFEKMSSIFNWVQGNIKYIAFEQGMRGFMPNSPELVCKNRYGDCKDMSSLLVGLLSRAGLNANYTWIGTRDIPLKYTEIPSTIVDNHMIATVESENKIYFLDATGSYTPFGYPTSMIQGKQAFIAMKDTFKVEEVPIVLKEDNLMLDSVNLKIEKGELSGTGKLTLTGLVKAANSYRIIQKTDDREENYIKKLLTKGSNKFDLKNYEIESLDNLNKPIVIPYQFLIEDYVKTINNKIYVDLMLEKSLITDVIENRTTPRENDYKYINGFVASLTLPEGYTVEFMPEDVTYKNDLFGYNMSYNLEGNRLTATKTFYLDHLILNPSQFDLWNEGIENYSSSLRGSVVLSKK